VQRMPLQRMPQRHARRRPQKASGSLANEQGTGHSARRRHPAAVQARNDARNAVKTAWHTTAGCYCKQGG
jgi:hypothetical protein